MTPDLPLFLSALVGAVVTVAALVRTWVFAKSIIQ